MPAVEAVGKSMHTVRQGESVRLKVKTLPNMPVNLTSFDLGAFQNGLASISVQADKEGIAEATFTVANWCHPSSER